MFPATATARKQRARTIAYDVRHLTTSRRTRLRLSSRARSSSSSAGITPVPPSETAADCCKPRSVGIVVVPVAALAAASACFEAFDSSTPTTDSLSLTSALTARAAPPTESATVGYTSLATLRDAACRQRRFHPRNRKRLSLSRHK